MSTTVPIRVPATAGPAVLTGTPVVPGVALGPVVRPSGAVRLPGRRAARACPRSARAAEKAAVRRGGRGGGRRGWPQRAAAATGVSAEVLVHHRRAGPRPRRCSSTVEQRIDAGAPAAVGDRRRPRSSSWTCSRRSAGSWPSGCTDVRDVRDRIVAELTGQGEPGVPSPDVPSVLLADDLAPADTAGLDPARVIGLATRLGGTTSHTAIIARQLGLPCVVAVGGLDDVPAGVTVLLDGEQGTVTVDPDPAEAPAAGRRGAGRRRGARRVRRAGDARATATPSRCWPTCRTAPARGPPSAAHAEGVGLFRTELSFLGHAAGAVGRGAGDGLRRRSSRPSPAGRSCCARWTPGRTSRWPSRPCPTRPTRRWASAGCGSPAATPACSSASSTRSPRRPRATGVDAVGHGADGGHGRRGGRLRGAGPRPGAGARRHDRGAVGGAARRPAARARRLPVDRHERPVAVHAGRRPAVGRPGRPHRPLAAGAPAAGRA